MIWIFVTLEALLRNNAFYIFVDFIFMGHDKNDNSAAKTQAFRYFFIYSTSIFNDGLNF